MAKPKRGPALFELLGEEAGRTQSVAPIPRWWSSGKSPVDLRAPRAARAGGEFKLVDDAGTLPQRTDTESLFEVEGNRVRVSFTSVGAATTIFLALAVVTAGYIIGSRSGDHAGFRRGYEAGRAVQENVAADEIQVARNQPPATHLLAPLVGSGVNPNTVSKPTKTESAPAVAAPTTPAASPSVTPTAKGWVKDLTYIVIQEYPAQGVEKARQAQQFLASKGVDAAVVTLGNGAVHLITAQGYNHKEPAQKKAADQLLSKIHTIGGQYYASGGGYKLEGYYKTLKRDSW